jgi:hypothetical protein
LAFPQPPKPGENWAFSYFGRPLELRCVSVSDDEVVFEDARRPTSRTPA